MKEAVHGRRQRNFVRGADEANRDRIDDRTVTGVNQALQAVVIPGTAGDLDEGPAL